jgi:hypothetical protein
MELFLAIPIALVSMYIVGYLMVHLFAGLAAIWWFLFEYKPGEE